jgi:hypothetical protein
MNRFFFLSLLTVHSLIDIIEAIEAASEVIIEEQDNPDTPDVDGITQIIDTLTEFIEGAANLRLPPDTSMPDPGDHNEAQKLNVVGVNARGFQATTG